MEIYEALMRENGKILAALDRLENTTAHRPEARSERFRELHSHVRVERKLAEDQLYPLLLASPKALPLLRRGHDENREIEELLAQLAAADPGESRTRYLLESLASLVQRHVEWEEHELFPLARAVISPEHAALLGEAAAGEQVEFYHRFLEE